MPVQQVQAPQFQLHISYFLQKCKKGKPEKNDLPLLKTISQQFFIDMILVFYSSKHKFWVDDFMLKFSSYWGWSELKIQGRNLKSSLLGFFPNFFFKTLRYIYKYASKPIDDSFVRSMMRQTVAFSKIWMIQWKIRLWTARTA